VTPGVDGDVSVHVDRLFEVSRVRVDVATYTGRQIRDGVGERRDERECSPIMK
jgi:hypothetical protein